jgi:hypothetical protein
MLFICLPLTPVAVEHCGRAVDLLYERGRPAANNLLSCTGSEE